MTDAARAEHSGLHISDDVMIEVSGLHKWYGQFHVLKNIDLTVYKGERIVVCGPSGSGKSTLIRCINRLEEHQRGRIVVDGVEQSNDLKQALRPYCVGGAYGRLLDAETEYLGSADVQAFEIEGLVGTGAAPAVLAYLFHRIGDRLDGRPTLLSVTREALDRSFGRPERGRRG